MFAPDGLKERWRIGSSAHALSNEDMEMALSSRSREDMIYDGHKSFHFETDVDQQSLQSHHKNDIRSNDVMNSFRQSNFTQNHRDRSAGSLDARNHLGDHHGNHPTLSNDNIRFNNKRAVANYSPPASSDWPTTIVCSPDQIQLRQQQSCTYQSNQHHFEPGAVGMATRYDIGTSYHADRFISSSYSSASPPDHLQTTPFGGVAHHRFSTPPGGGSQFYGEPATASGLDVGVPQDCLTPPSLSCSPIAMNAGCSLAISDIASSGLDVGVPRAVGGLTPGVGFPSMTVNLSMSMNLVETPAAARRVLQPTQQAWNAMGGLSNEDADADDDDDNDIEAMRWPTTTYSMLQSQQQHVNHNQQSAQNTYRCGRPGSPRNGWRLHAVPTGTCFKRSPISGDCGDQTSAHQVHSGSDDDHVFMPASMDAARKDIYNHEQQSRYESSVMHHQAVPPFVGDVTNHHSRASPPQYQHRREFVDRSGIVGRQISARYHHQHRVFPSAAPQNFGANSSSTHSLHSMAQSQQHHHHHHQRSVVVRNGLRSSQNGGHTCTLAMARGGTTDAGLRGGPNGSVDSLNGRPNVCRICDKTYARPSTLKTHLRTHSGEKPYTCGTCRKAFSQAANLTAHLRTHTGERPFSCPVCSRRFSQSSSVATHLRTHSGERPYRCRLCSKTFSDSSTLTKHLRIHSGEKPYQCSVCLLRFSQSGNLNRHKRVHGTTK